MKVNNTFFECCFQRSLAIPHRRQKDENNNEFWIDPTALQIVQAMKTFYLRHPIPIQLPY